MGQVAGTTPLIRIPVRLQTKQGMGCVAGRRMLGLGLGVGVAVMVRCGVGV